MEKLNACPVCNNNQTIPFLDCLDYTVSKETFSIEKCSSCDFLYTNPRPSMEKIGPYYKAEAYVSHTNSKKGLINKVYHLVRNFTLREKLNIVNNNTEGKNLLDYGCGTGYFLNYLNNNGYNGVGVEPDDEARKLAEENTGKNIITPDQIENIADNSLDVITLWHVLEHVHNLNELIEIFHRKLNSAGVLLIAVPNPDSFDAKHYKENWAAYDVPRHLYHFTPKTITQLMAKHNLKDIKTYPMIFDSYYVSMLSEKNIGGNLVKAFINGFKSNWKSNSSKTPQSSSQVYLFKK